MTEKYAAILPVGPGQIDNVLDTIESLLHYSGPDLTLFVIDDFTSDGTFERLAQLTDPRIVLLRTEKAYGYRGLQATTALAFRECVARGPYSVILRIDWDALVIGPGVWEQAQHFASTNTEVGIFGRHLINYDGTSKNYRVHTGDMLYRWGFPPRDDDREEGGIGWISTLALKNGWGLGENIFGGAFFLTYECVVAMIDLGFLDRLDDPEFWVIEDVFFTMCAMAAGFERAHFAAPTGPLAVSFGHLPAPARELHDRGMKIIHSVDKGRWTSADEHGGEAPRDYFRAIRNAELALRKHDDFVAS